MDFFVSDHGQDERLIKDANFMDDVDIVHVDGKMCAVAVRGDRHACWLCGEHFNESVPKLKKTVVAHGFSHLLLHAKCEGGKSGIRVFFDRVRGHQARRFLTKATKGLSNEAGT